MKLISLLMAKAILIICSVSSLYAQDESSNLPIEYGVKFGAVSSEFVSSYHSGARLGFTMGVFGSYEINEIIGIQAELAYFQFGGTYLQFIDNSRFGGSDDVFNKNVTDGNVTLHNVFLPIQLSIKPFDNPALPLFLIGPYVSYTPYATETYQTTGQLDGGVFVTTAGKNRVTDQYRDFQFGASIGLQFEIPTESNYSVIIGANYNYGLTPVKQSFSYIDFVGVTENIYNNALSFSVGVKF